MERNVIHNLVCFVILITLTLSSSSASSSSSSSSSSSPQVRVGITVQPLDHNKQQHIVTHYTCFGTIHNYDDNDDDDGNDETSTKHKCCSDIVEKGRNLPNPTPTTTPTTTTTPTYTKCMDIIAKVPNVMHFNHNAYESSKQTNTLMLPLYHLSTVVAMKQEMDLYNVPSQLLNSSFTPFHLDNDNNNDNENGNENENENNGKKSRNKLNNVSTFRASLGSTLSTEGGMHRPFMHSLNLIIPSSSSSSLQHIGKDYKYKDQGKDDEIHENEERIDDEEQIILKSIMSSSSIIIEGEMIMLLPISEEYFLDLDDPFQDDVDQACHILYQDDENENISNNNDNVVTKCQIEVITLPNAVIDIEQPSFASPQHVVAFRINYDINISPHSDYVESLSKLPNSSSLSPSSLVIDFVPTLHLRYQPPILEKNNAQQKDKDGYISIPVPKTFLYSGIMTTKFEFEGGRKYKKSYSLDTFEQQGEASINTIDVASGFDKHHDLVMTVTMAACIIGALQMIRDFSKVGYWY